MPKAREMLEKEGKGGEYGGREESGEGPRGRRRAIPGRASWNASERVQTSRYWSASISRGLISSITEFELGTYCTCSRHMRVRRSRERERENEKKYVVTQCHHMCAPGEMFRRPDSMDTAKLSDGRILRRWRVTLVLIDHYAARSTQQAINNSSLFLRIRTDCSSRCFPTGFPEIRRLLGCTREPIVCTRMNLSLLFSLLPFF